MSSNSNVAGTVVSEVADAVAERVLERANRQFSRADIRRSAEWWAAQMPKIEARLKTRMND